MSKKKKTSATVKEVTKVKYKMGHSGPRDGLFTYYTQKARDDRPETWLAAMKEMYSSDDSEDPRQRVLERINSMEENLTHMRQAEDHTGDNPERWTVAAHLDASLRVLGAAKRDIDAFKEKCTDDALLNEFYKAIDSMLVLTGSVEQLTFKRYEVVIIKGRAVDSNHKNGASKQVMMDAIREVRARKQKYLDEELPDRKANAKAVKEVAGELGVSRESVYGWLGKQKKSVVVTKTITQDDD